MKKDKSKYDEYGEHMEIHQNLMDSIKSVPPNTEQLDMVLAICEEAQAQNRIILNMINRISEPQYLISYGKQGAK